jgi:hypothetical protein
MLFPPNYADEVPYAPFKRRPVDPFLMLRSAPLLLRDMFAFESLLTLDFVPNVFPPPIYSF